MTDYAPLPARVSSSSLTTCRARLRARQSEGIVDIGSQQLVVTSLVLGSIQALVDKADHQGNGFKGPPAQVHYRSQEDHRVSFCYPPLSIFQPGKCRPREVAEHHLLSLVNLVALLLTYLAANDRGSDDEVDELVQHMVGEGNEGLGAG